MHADDIRTEELLDHATTLYDLEKYDQAEKKFAQALVKNPSSSFALWGVGSSLLMRGKVKEGLKELEKGLTIYPENESFFHQLTVYAINKGFYDKSLELIKDWFRHHPNSIDAHVYYAKTLLYKDSKDKKTIFEHLRQAKRIDPFDYEAIDGMAQALWKFHKDKDGAMKEYKAALTHFPEKPHLHNNFGVLLLKIGESKQALEEFKTAIRLDPNFPIAVDNIGQALAALHPSLSWIYKLDVFLNKNRVRKYIIVGLLYIFFKPLLILYFIYAFFGYSLFKFAFKKGWIH